MLDLVNDVKENKESAAAFCDISTFVYMFSGWQMSSQHRLALYQGFMKAASRFQTRLSPFQNTQDSRQRSGHSSSDAKTSSMTNSAIQALWEHTRHSVQPDSATTSNGKGMW